MGAGCEVRRRFRSCSKPGIARCQYCGRNFCAEHGLRLDDGQEICARPTCQEKKTDLEPFFAYKEEVAARNQQRACGEAECASPPTGQCSKCGGLFCRRHLQERLLEQRRGSTVVREPASLCRRCLARRRLWSRT